MRPEARVTLKVPLGWGGGGQVDEEGARDRRRRKVDKVRVDLGDLIRAVAGLVDGVGHARVQAVGAELGTPMMLRA